MIPIITPTTARMMAPSITFSFQGFLSKRFMIDLIQHVPILLSANIGGGSYRDVCF